MFTFALITGGKNGWRDAPTYGPAARRGRRVRECRHELRIVRGVIGLKSGIARGIYAGRAAERIDLQSRVVGNCRTACRRRGMSALEQCIREEA